MTLRDALDFVLDYPLRDLGDFLISLTIICLGLWFAFKIIKAFYDGFMEGYNKED